MKETETVGMDINNMEINNMDINNMDINNTFIDVIRAQLRISFCSPFI